jgi:hypothetical protein
MSKLSRDDNGQLCNFGRLGASQVISVTTTSQQSSAFGAGTTIVRLANTSTAHLHYEVGANPTASNSTSECLPINAVEYIEVTPGHKIAVVCGTTTTFSVTEII